MTASHTGIAGDARWAAEWDANRYPFFGMLVVVTPFELFLGIDNLEKTDSSNKRALIARLQLYVRTKQ